MHVLLRPAITALGTVAYLTLRRLKHRMYIATCEVLSCEQESAVPVVVDAAAPGLWPLGTVAANVLLTAESSTALDATS